MLLRDRDDANVFYEEFEYLLPLYVKEVLIKAPPISKDIPTGLEVNIL